MSPLFSYVFEDSGLSDFKQDVKDCQSNILLGVKLARTCKWYLFWENTCRCNIKLWLYFTSLNCIVNFSAMPRKSTLTTDKCC